MLKLTSRQRAFVLAYVANGGCGAKAAIAAGYSEKGANVTAAKLLAKSIIAREIARRQNAVAKRLDINAENLMLETARCAFSDIRRLFDGAGNLKRVADLDADTAAAIAAIEVKLTAEGDLVTKVKLWPKVDALRTLGVMLGLVDPRRRAAADEHQGMDAAELRESLAALSDEQRAQFKGICEALAARRAGLTGHEASRRG